jgi:hypothetical protein
MQRQITTQMMHCCKKFLVIAASLSIFFGASHDLICSCSELE